LHHISSAKIGLGIGLASLLPLIGVLRSDDLKKVNILPVFFVAAALSMAQVLVTTKSLDLLTTVAFGWIAPLITNYFLATVVLYWAAFFYHMLLSSDIAMLGTSMPPLMTFAKTNGLSPLILGMIWVFGSAGKIFVYQSAVLIVGYSFGYFKSRDLLRLGILLTLVEFVAILLIVPFYWPLIGVR
jgi:di/tricarboxylate transporter